MQQEKTFLSLPGKRICNKQYKCRQQLLQANHDTPSMQWTAVQIKATCVVSQLQYNCCPAKRMHALPCLGL